MNYWKLDSDSSSCAILCPFFESMIKNPSLRVNLGSYKTDYYPGRNTAINANLASCKIARRQHQNMVLTILVVKPNANKCSAGPFELLGRTWSFNMRSGINGQMAIYKQSDAFLAYSTQGWLNGQRAFYCRRSAAFRQPLSCHWTTLEYGQSLVIRLHWYFIPNKRLWHWHPIVYHGCFSNKCRGDISERIRQLLTQISTRPRCNTSTMACILSFATSQRDWKYCRHYNSAKRRFERDVLH